MHLAIHLNKEKRLKVKLREVRQKRKQRAISIQSRKSSLLLDKDNQPLNLIDNIYFLTTNNKGTSSEQLSDGESMALYLRISLANKEQTGCKI